ncbi:MAG: pilin [Dokdonella sp.]
MRHGLITFVASMIGVLVALLAYRTYDRHALEQSRKAELQVQQQSQQQGEQLDAMVAAEQRAIEAIRADVVAASPAKLAIAEYYMSMARMPTSNAEAGVPEPTKYRGRSLRSMAIVDGGRLRLEFDAVSGREGGVIELVPDLGGAEAMGVQWLCTTRDFPQIVRALPSCEYVGRK